MFESTEGLIEIAGDLKTRIDHFLPPVKVHDQNGDNKENT